MTNGDATFAVQAIGVVAIGAFVAVSSAVVWGILSNSLGLRPTLEEELSGLDQVEIGIEAYPEFGRGSQII